MENHIFIYNEIGQEGDHMVSLQDVQAQYSPDADSVFVHINSPGGSVSEGKAIFDFLNSLPQDVHTIGEGMVASIATLPFLAGKTRTMKPNAEFLGHLPSMQVAGNSDEIERANNYIQEKRDELASIYSNFTKDSVDKMVEFMREDTPISSQKAKEMGFATDIEKFQAVAKYNFNKHMSETKEAVKTEDNLEKASDNWAKEFIASIKKAMNMDESTEVVDEVETVENMTVTLADGASIFVETEDGEFEGKMAFVVDEEGNRTETPVPAGTYDLEDGRSITVGEDGMIVSVQEMEAEGNEEMENLKAELAEANAKLEAANAKNDEMSNEINVLKEASATIIEEVKNLKKMTAGGEPTVKKVHIENKKKEEVRTGLEGLAARLNRK